MSWPRQSLFIALVALSTQWAAADTLTVNTTADTVSNDGKCSLREAVEYFNLGKPSGGYMGCRSPSADDLDVVSLPVSASPYLISSGPIRVHKSLAITGSSSSEESKSVVSVQGGHRAFVVYDEPVFRAPACAATSTCEPAGTNSPYNDAPHLEDTSDTGTSTIDNLTPIHTPVFKGTVQIPAPTSQTVTTFPDASTRVETTTEKEYRVVVILYGTPSGGERSELGATYADDVTGDWLLQATGMGDGQYEFVYKTRADETVTTTTVTYDLPANTIRGTSSSVVLNAGTTLSSDSAAATVAIYTVPSRRTLVLSSLELIGCGLDAGCADDADGTFTYSNTSDRGLVYDYVISGTAGRGGLIYSREGQLLESVILSSGVATTGGAIYLGNDAVAVISNAEFEGNKAQDGVAVYAEMNGLLVDTSLFRGNVATGASGAVLHVASVTTPTSSGQTSSEFTNITVSGNDARAMNLRGGMTVNASTLVLNAKGGIEFNGQNVGVYNSILAGNHTLYATAPDVPVAPFEDCLNYAAGATPPSVMKNSLVLNGAGCPESGNGIQAIDNAPGTVEQLMATNVSGGICNSPYGLLCPLADNGGPNQTHLPRLLGLYTSISDSPIVNKGALDDPAVTGSCPDSDQRGEGRAQLSCDIGAVELQFIPASEVIISGGSTVFGKAYEQSLDFDLKDEELLAVAYCPATPPGDPALVVPGSYRPDVPGCPWLEKKPQKGSVSFGAVGEDGRYYYRARTDFHGFDRFQVRIMTNVSRLNDDPADQSRPVEATVIVEPASGITSSNVGGALDEVGLLMMALLGARRFGRRRARS